jgi:phosphocarrier protein HPr
VIQKTFIVDNDLGLHARPAALFVRLTQGFQCQVRVSKIGQPDEVDGKSIMGILTLAAEKGSQLAVTADGPDEQQLIEKLDELFRKKFEEG